MKTRTHTRRTEFENDLLQEERESLDLESLSDDELEHLLFQEEATPESGFWNLPTIAGLSLIVVGAVYILQELGFWNGFDITVLAEMLPWLAGVLIILLGFGVLSWRPKKKTKVKRTVRTKKGREKVVVESSSKAKARIRADGKRRLVRSRNKKVSGVAAGIAEYFNIDPTLVRIAFVVGMIASGGPPVILAYIIMAIVMPEAESDVTEKTITIIKD